MNPDPKRNAETISRAPGEGAPAPRLPEATPTRFGPYVVERALAQGGMGAVFVARHAQLGRQVAIKIMIGATARRRQRFATEALVTAKLRHPNIVSIHGAGQEGQIPYLVMDLIDGESLADRIEREGPLPHRDAATLTRSLADALQAAHDQGVLHRDMKPDNVLINRDGQPLITDFGLAKDVDAQTLTKTGQMLGTIAYMPPEQATGARQRIGPHSDVYSLGATLYEMLGGAPPFRGDSPVNVLVAVATQDPPPLRREHPSVDPYLEAICLKCLAKAPQDRYPSARALAEDLERWLSGAPTLARPRAGRRGVAALVGVLLAAGLGLGVAAGILREPLPPTAPLAEPPPPPEEQASTPPGLSPASLAAGTRRLKEIRLLPDARKIAAASEWLATYPGHPKTPTLQTLRRAACLTTPVRTVLHPACRGAQFLDRAEVVVTFGLSEPLGLRFWSAESGKEIHSWPTGAVDLVVAPDDATIYFTLDDAVYSCTLERPPALLHQARDGVGPLAVSPSGRRLAVGNASRTVEILELPSGKRVAELDHSQGGIRTLHFYDDNLLATGTGATLDRKARDSNQAAVRVWFLDDPQRTPATWVMLAAVQAVGFSPTSPRLAVACNGENLFVYDDVERGGGPPSLRLRDSAPSNLTGSSHQGVIYGLAFAPDGTRLASVSRGLTDPAHNEIHLWDAESGADLWSARVRPNRPTRVDFDPSGTKLLVATLESAEIWDLSGLDD